MNEVSLDALPLPVLCLVLERIDNLTPERLVQLSRSFGNRKWVRACRDDVPWRAALLNTGCVSDIPKSGLYDWFVNVYVPQVAPTVNELHLPKRDFVVVWHGSNLYGRAVTRKLEENDCRFDDQRSECSFVGVGGNLCAGFLGMKSMSECMHPYCRSRVVVVLACQARETGNFYAPEQTHSHWLQCLVCKRKFWFEEIGYG